MATGPSALRECFPRLLRAACAAILFGMMLLTVADVVLRYFVGAPIRGAFELTELSLAMLIYAGLPLVALAGGHVVTDLIDSVLSQPGRRVLAFAVEVLCGAVLVGVAWMLYAKAGSLAEARETTTELRIRIAPIVYAISVLLLAAALAHFWNALRGSRAGAAGPGTL